MIGCHRIPVNGDLELVTPLGSRDPGHMVLLKSMENEFEYIYGFLTSSTYPPDMIKDKKRNFRRKVSK